MSDICGFKSRILFVLVYICVTLLAQNENNGKVREWGQEILVLKQEPCGSCRKEQRCDQFAKFGLMDLVLHCLDDCGCKYRFGSSESLSSTKRLQRSLNLNQKLADSQTLSPSTSPSESFTSEEPDKNLKNSNKHTTLLLSSLFSDTSINDPEESRQASRKNIASKFILNSKSTIFSKNDDFTIEKRRHQETRPKRDSQDQDREAPKRNDGDDCTKCINSKCNQESMTGRMACYSECCPDINSQNII